MQRNGKTKIFSKTFDTLVESIEKALRAYIEPEVFVENVIRYNIESHVSFAETMEGDISPNASGTAKWVTGHLDSLFGHHHAANPSDGGYSLTIGAIAYTKTTYIYGVSKKVKYEKYYGEGSDLTANDPASLLNSWCSFSLPRNPEEIPYTDEAAMFFHKLMLGMAELSRKIQSFAGDKENLIQFIEKGGRLLLTAPTNSHVQDRCIGGKD